MTVFTLPDLGEGLQEAEIVTWHVGEGDHVIADQPLVSVETDKAVVEVPAPYSGTIARLVARVGDVLAVGQPLVDIDTGKAEDSGAIVGRLDADEKPRPVQPVAPPAGGDVIRATPAARKLAREQDIDLSRIEGTGPGGVIQTTDVASAAPRGVAGEGLRGPRRAMAQAMARSHETVVPATIMDKADVTAWDTDENPTLRLISAIVAACAAEPALNVWFDGKNRQLHDHVDLAVAVDSENGLFAPVLRHAENPEGIAERLSALKAAVKNRTLTPEALKGGTVTLSNFGMMGGEHAVLVVSPPQVAIIGAGRIGDAVVWHQGQPQKRRLLPLSLSFDHRVVTGGEAARFLAACRADLERPSIANTET